MKVFGLDANSYSITGVTTPTATMSGGHIGIDVIPMDRLGNVLGSSASPVVVSQNSASLAMQGKSFVYASGVLSLTAAGNLRITFQNPAGSGVLAAVSSLVTYNSAGVAATALFYQNPTTGLPTNPGTSMNNYIGAAAPKCMLKADTSLATALSGGNSLITIAVAPGKEPYDKGVFYVPPGFTIGFNLAFAGQATAELVVYAAELPL